METQPELLSTGPLYEAHSPGKRIEKYVMVEGASIHNYMGDEHQDQMWILFQRPYGTEHWEISMSPAMTARINSSPELKDCFIWD